jgi:hypothetical protein
MAKRAQGTPFVGRDDLDERPSALLDRPVSLGSIDCIKGYQAVGNRHDDSMFLSKYRDRFLQESRHSYPTDPELFPSFRD